MRADRSFNKRSLTTFIVTLSFLFMIFSGVMLYVSPKGRVANWTGWTLCGLEKEQWGSVHTTMAIVFVVAGAFHLYFNWAVFWRYLKNAAAMGVRSKRELGLAAIVVVVVFGGTLWSLPPFGTVIGISDNIKDYWESRSTLAYPHAEESTVAEFADRMGIPLNELLTDLRDSGYELEDPTVTTMGELARKYGKSPDALFAEIRPQAPGARRGAGAAPGGGMGRMTLEEVCETTGVPLQTALDALARHGIQAQPSDTLKEIAEKAGKTPRDLLPLISGQVEDNQDDPSEVQTEPQGPGQGRGQGQRAGANRPR